jgi:membrane protein
MSRLQALQRDADGLQQRHVWLAFPLAVWKKFSDDRAGQLAALIAYYAFS